MTRLLTAAAAVALAAGFAAPQIAAAQAAHPKTESAAAAATGKATTDAPASTAVQGTAKAMQQGVAPVASAPVAGTSGGAMVEAKPVAVSGDMMDTLRLSGQFTTFVQGIDATNLTGLLKTNKNLTVFAPTDRAFAAMPPAVMTKLKADKAAMQKFILHHIVNAPIPSSKIKGAKGPVPTGAGDQIVLDGSDEGGTLKIDDATIVQADVQTSSGLLQVIDKVLTSDAPTSAAASAAGAQASATAANGAPAKP